MVVNDYISFWWNLWKLKSVFTEWFSLSWIINSWKWCNWKRLMRSLFLSHTSFPYWTSMNKNLVYLTAFHVDSNTNFYEVLLSTLGMKHWWTDWTTWCLWCYALCLSQMENRYCLGWSIIYRVEGVSMCKVGSKWGLNDTMTWYFIKLTNCFNWGFH